MGWGRAFDDPIPLPTGGNLETLSDAAAYIIALSPKLQDAPEWKTATATLIDAAEGRDFILHARIAVMRALNRDLPPPGPHKRAAKKYKIVS